MGITKYRSKKTACCYGHIHDSSKEAHRCGELHLLQRAGVISNLQFQVKYELIPGAYETVKTGKYYVRGPKAGEPKTKTVCIEKPCYYVADFVYTENGKTVIEDCKGMRTKEYIIKRKLLRQKYCNENTAFLET